MEHIIVGALASFEEDWHLSHGVRANGLLSAIGVGELITAGALVELRVVARDPRGG